MNICFWGPRGSIATPLTNAELSDRIKTILRQAIMADLTDPSLIDSFFDNLPWYLRQTVGGDTSCVEVQVDDEIIILDAGTGIRPLGLDIMARSHSGPRNIRILISHTHWDHIAGFPFFVPAYVPGNTINIYGPHSMLESRFRRQQESEYYPVPLDQMGADIHFIQINKYERFNIKNVEITAFPLHHPGGCFAYRISAGGKTMVSASDAEYQDMSPEAMQPFFDFFQDADLLIFDAQYTMIESIERENWGHSTATIGIDIALEVGVKHLVLTHHEPTHDDKKLWEMFQGAKDYLAYQNAEDKLELSLAYEGLKIML